jgi:hypothetical protein
MTKKQCITLLFALLAVAGVYYYLFLDTRGRPDIQISHTLRADNSALLRRNAGTPLENIPKRVIFALQGAYKLTELKVVSISELATNEHALPVWHLVSDSNSIPIRGFFYGERIRGMRSAIKDAAPEPLATNVPYRLYVEAGRLKAQHDFTLGGD